MVLTIHVNGLDSKEFLNEEVPENTTGLDLMKQIALKHGICWQKVQLLTGAGTLSPQQTVSNIQGRNSEGVLEVTCLIYKWCFMTVCSSTRIISPNVIQQQCDEQTMCVTDRLIDNNTQYFEFRCVKSDYAGDVRFEVGITEPKEWNELNLRSKVPAGVPRTGRVSRLDGVFMRFDSCKLYGPDQRVSPSMGSDCVEEGDRIGMLVKGGPGGFVRYYKNGEAFGYSWEGPVKTQSVVVVQMHWEGTMVEIVPDAEMPHVSDDSHPHSLSCADPSL